MLAMLYQIDLSSNPANESAKELIHYIAQEHLIVRMSLIQAQAAVAARKQGRYVDPVDV